MKAMLVLALLATPAYATPYRCEGVRSGERTGNDPELIGMWQQCAHAATLDDHWANEVLSMPEGLPTPQSLEERVRVQHAALEIARRSAGGTGRVKMAHDFAVAYAAKIAPTAAELEKLGEYPRLQGVLGDAVVERATQTCGSGNSIHVAVNGGLFAFRPLRAGTTRALVAQLVAFDGKGHPHVTPFVEAIEMRLGDAVDAPACVVESFPDGALRPERLDRIEQRPPFVMRSGEGVGCNGCHSSSNAMNARDIAGAELVKIDQLRTEQVEKLAEGFWQSVQH